MLRRKWFFVLLVFLLIGSGVFFLVEGNNPYTPFTRVETPFTTSFDAKGQLVLHTLYTPRLHTNQLFTTFAVIQSGIRIALNAFISEPPLPGNEAAVINQIHTERFDPSKIYIISGGHFADMYPRNLGIFYNSLLDPCLPSSQRDWENRGKVALQTTAFNLALLSQAKEEPTTFMPIWSRDFVPVNVYTRPSDSLYGLLYTLDAMQQDRFHSLYKEGTVCHSLQTQKATKIVLQQYKPTLARLVQQYEKDVLDPKTDLIKTSITLSSARDGIKRQSSFYDNVIAWKTLSLAKDLGIYDSHKDFEKWKQQIINSFWDANIGIFLDDLSSYSKTHHSFSGDSFIVVQTGFLDMQNTEDQKKLTQMIGYVEKNKLDQPLPLAYSTEDRVERLYPAVRLAATSYMGTTRWSHWGMEYLKALLLVSPDNKEKVNYFLSGFKQKIEQYGGYPELYDKNGNIYRGALYKSVLHTGWVINYEEVKAVAAQQ